MKDGIVQKHDDYTKLLIEKSIEADMQPSGQEELIAAILTLAEVVEERGKAVREAIMHWKLA